MQVVLRQDVEKLGDAGSVVTVKDGYARNFLVPRKLAYVATAGALKRIEQRTPKFLLYRKMDCNRALITAPKGEALG